MKNELCIKRVNVYYRNKIELLINVFLNTNWHHEYGTKMMEGGIQKFKHVSRSWNVNENCHM